MYVHAQAPARIGIAGGGTDLPAWTSSGRVGRCLSLAINRYTHAVAIHRPDKMVVASYLKRDFSPSATEIANGLIRESALLHGWEDSFEVHTLAELSSHGTGLGVSSSIAVALSACFRLLTLLRKSTKRERTGDFVYSMLEGSSLRIAPGNDHIVFEEDPEARWAIARDAWVVEIDKLRRPIGRQDHMAAAYGGLKLYTFRGTDARVERVFSKEESIWLARHLVLVKLPDGHDARGILSNVKSAEMLEAADAAVGEAISAISTRNAQQLGKALGQGHASKCSIPGAVLPEIEKIVRSLESLPAVYGAKIAGAGGGGHIVVACEPGSADEISRHVELPVTLVEPDFSGVWSDGWP